MHILWNKGVFYKFFKIERNIVKRTMASADNLYNKIDTFVFFDLETTDLIKGTMMPKITELSMVAASRNSLRCDTRNKLALPRIMHKLTLPICPMRPIKPQASFTSNLWNDTLENIKPFDENTYDLIMQFIDRLPGLICFVAHNGNSFDYPIFLSEIEQLNKTFPDRILCVDTLKAFREFFTDVPQIVEKPIQYIPEGHDEVDEELTITKKKFDNLLNDEWNNALCSVVDTLEESATNRNKYTSSSKLISEKGKDVLDSITNEKQTDSNSSGPSTPKHSPKSMQAINEKTPESQIIRNSHINSINNSRKILDSARKQLNFGKSKPKNFKLSTLYMHLVGSDAENLHCAEADCISMLRCVCQMGPYFAEWADYNAVSLNLFKIEKKINTA